MDLYLSYIFESKYVSQQKQNKKNTAKAEVNIYPALKGCGNKFTTYKEL